MLSFHVYPKLTQSDRVHSTRSGIVFTVAAAGSAFLMTSYRIASQDKRNSQPGNLHVRTERSGEFGFV